MKAFHFNEKEPDELSIKFEKTNVGEQKPANKSKPLVLTALE